MPSGATSHRSSASPCSNGNGVHWPDGHGSPNLFVSCLGGEQLTFFGATPGEKQDRKAHRLCFSLREHQPYDVGASRSDGLDPVRVCLGTSSFDVRLRQREIVGTREAGWNKKKRVWSAWVTVAGCRECGINYYKTKKKVGGR